MKYRKQMEPLRGIDVYLNILSLFLRGRRPEARSLAIQKLQQLLRKYYAKRGHAGVRVMEEPWDYLIILDACRYDYFECTFPRFLQGDLQKRVSQGTSTSEWLKKNFTAYHADTVYVSGNPHCSDHEINGFRGTDHFHAIEHVWKHAWNEELDTLPPEEMTRSVLAAREKFPDKRMIIHFIQPHGPWIGETRISVPEIGLDPNHPSAVDGKWTVDNQVWELARQGKFDLELLKRADMDNLVFVLGEVKKLVAELDGRIVVTADHGEAFGEKIVLGHPSGVYLKELVEIPWLLIDKGRKSVTTRAGVMSAKETQNPQTVTDGEEILAKRLRALGYIE